MTDRVSLEIHSLRQAYLENQITPAEVIDNILAKCDEFKHHNIWITLLDKTQLNEYLQQLEKADINSLPLYGIPFAIKDNIDLAGIPTTAACEAYSYTPEKSAFVVEQLIAAGAIPIGKTNLDQFATGLVGTRSPDKWGVAKNAFDPAYISGGSSSGSALAVALGLASFSLGTDTAGSGRVPAAFNNLVGLKPSKGLLSTTGVVPACRSLDCVSIFALTANDANSVFDVAAGYDQQDSYSRDYHFANYQKSYGALTSKPVIGYLADEQLQTYGDDETASLYRKHLEDLKQQGFELRAVNFEPFAAAAKLLYEGPWVAERFAAVGEYLADMLEVTAGIIVQGNDKTAVDYFQSEYQLQAYKKLADAEFEQVDVIVTPTVPGHYTLDELEREPVKLNSQLGYYTNFMNLLDFSAIACPAAFRENGLPFGVTFFAPAFDDLLLLSLAQSLQAPGSQLGNTSWQKSIIEWPAAQTGHISVAVCGAHLEGLPLNWQLLQRKGRLLEKTTTANCYRFYALAGGPPFRPGLIRVTDGSGAGIAVEIWQVPADLFGSFVAGIPAPLGIGKLELEDGRWVTSFICEGYAIDDAEDITGFGNWRDFISSKK